MEEKRISLGEFGRLIREKRIALDWSVERLALEMCRSKRTIYVIESGSRPVCQRTMAQIERIWPDIKIKPQLSF